MTLRNYVTVLIFIIISACKNSTKTTPPPPVKDTFVINVKRYERGHMEDYKVDKRDYKIIQHLDTLANSAFRIKFRTNFDRQITGLTIQYKYREGRSTDAKTALFNELKRAIFQSNYKLSNLKSLVNLTLELSSFDQPVKLKFPSSLNYLKALSIIESPVKRIEFDPNNQLGLLRLVYCDVTKLDSVMINLNQLETLFVMNNKIKDINIDTKQYRNLKLLNLSKNPLQIPIDSLKKRYPSIKIFFNENQRFSESLQ